jgi:hypothetical protein
MALETRVRSLEERYIRMDERLVMHLDACEKRSARLEKLAWASGGLLLAVLGLLLKTLFHL